MLCLSTLNETPTDAFAGRGRSLRVCYSAPTSPSFPNSDYLFRFHACRLDSYPQRFDCSHPATWNPVVTTYHEYHARVNPAQPWYIPGPCAFSFLLPSSPQAHTGVLVYIRRVPGRLV